jgi:aromatic-L-amino-acid decarboxylase
MAQEFADWVRTSEEFELVAPVPLNLVCFAHKNGNDFNRKLLETINKTGEMYFTHTVIKGQFVLRMCIAQTHTQHNHVVKAWKTIQETAKELSRIE